MRRSTSWAVAGTTATLLLLAMLPAAAATATSHAVAVAPASSPAFVPNAACGTGTPAYNYEGSGDAADPQVVYSGGTYYAFTTGNALGNNIAALVSTSPDSGFGPYTAGLLSARPPCPTPPHGSNRTRRRRPACSNTTGTG